MKIYDIISLSLAYLGNFLISHWLILSHLNYGIYGCNLTTYITHIGGLI